MNPTRTTTPTHDNTPSPAPGDTSDRIRDGPYTNKNANPLANTVNGDTSSLAANTHIQNYQCQSPQNNYTNCNFYGGDHTPASQHPIARDRAPTTGVGVASSNALSHEHEPQSLLIPFYWPWALLSSFIRVFLRAGAISGVERMPRDILPRNIQDLEDRPNTDRFPPSSNPTRAPGSSADELA
ncbi:hypothetical protein PQX77_022154 [Marasmius sp. AFHP31]|nr:hypothetical protein PQX77_022154 [Marasmius sp. AFHP31]